jgi:REP element-mobilizing transposase RayT
MSIHTVVNKEGIYFITFTCHNWLPLIELTKGYDFVYQFYSVLESQSHTILSYVIMPNHLHFLMHFGAGSLNTFIGNGKRFMAYEIIKRIKFKEKYDLLQQLQIAVSNSDQNRGKKYEVWIKGFDVKECRTESFILQKLNYVHQNPVSGKWKLCKSAQDYLHSSCLFYFNGKYRFYKVSDYKDFTRRVPH